MSLLGDGNGYLGRANGIEHDQKITESRADFRVVGFDYPADSCGQYQAIEGHSSAQS